MKTVMAIAIAVIAASASADAQQRLKPRLARVGIVQVDGQRPVLEVVANAPLAFNVLVNGRRLDVRIYGVEPGLVPVSQVIPFGRVAVIKEKRGNVLLRITPTRRQTFEVRSGARPNIIEITPR